MGFCVWFLSLTPNGELIRNSKTEPVQSKFVQTNFFEL